MDPITTWQLSVDGVGSAEIGTGAYRYAGGFVVAVLGGGNGWSIFNLGNSEVAVAVAVMDQDNTSWTYYWNSHYGMPNGYNNGSMMLWLGTNPEFSSDSIGAEQTFRIANLGQGTISLQATAGSFPGQYLSAVSGGWYPHEWSLGDGSFVSVPSPAPIRISGDLLPLLQITNSGYRTDLTGRDLGTLSLAGANLVECVLAGATLGAVSSIAGADFTSANLRGAHLGTHDLATAKTWAAADFTGSDLTTVAGAAAAHLERAILDNANLTGRNLAGAFLQGASLRGTTLTGADLTGANLDGAHLDGAHLDGTILHGASLRGTHFDGSDLSTAQFDPVPQFARSTTSRTTFVGSTVPFPVLRADWSYLDLTDANITQLPSAISDLVADEALLPNGLRLEGVALRGSSFAGARMYEVQLQGANLEGAMLRNALLKGAKLSGANLTLANLDSAYLIAEGAPLMRKSATSSGELAAALGDKLEAAVVTDAFLFNTILDGAHCDGVDFSGSLFLTAASVSGTQSASAVGATMNFAKFDGCSVVLTVFNGAQLSAASFAAADLTGASFQDNGAAATQLTPSSDPTHTPASVYTAHLEGTNFAGANMDGLNMRGASVATSGGDFEKIYEGFGGTKVPVAFHHGPTQLGVTTSNTTCPAGNNGPCSL